jgi:hypothetical protein
VRHKSIFISSSQIRPWLQRNEKLKRLRYPLKRNVMQSNILSGASVIDKMEPIVIAHYIPTGI